MKIEILCEPTDQRKSETVKLIREVVADLGVRAEINELKPAHQITEETRSPLRVLVNGYDVTSGPEVMQMTAGAVDDNPRYEKIRAAVERFAWQD